MPVKTNRAITQSDEDEDKLPRQLIPVVLPGGKQPGGSLPDPPALQEVNHQVAGDVAVVTPSSLGKALYSLPMLTIPES